MAKWLLKNKRADFKKMSETLHISEIIARILVNREINTKAKCKSFLNPDISELGNILKMKGVKEAFEILESARQGNGGKIVIYGDYDVDGVMSTVILLKGLKALGFTTVDYYIPHRMTEGYGLNVDAIKNIKENYDADILIACDNGISATKELDFAKEVGLKTIIIDHHEPTIVEDKEVILSANAVIDPKQHDCEYPFKLMCAGGLSYRFICGLHEFLEKNISQKLHNELLIFAGIATVCDIVDLQAENRIIVRYAVNLLNNSGHENLNLGLKTLLKLKSYHNRHIGEFAIGYMIGPCINASGRLEHAKLAVELFLTEDEGIAHSCAELMSSLNDERKEITRAAFERLTEKVDQEALEKVIVIYDKEIHESIAGIVAGRLKEKFYRPTIVISKGEDFAKGSARSIEGYNIFEEFSKNRELFVRFGGHPMAAGLSIEEKSIDVLRKRLNETCTLEGDDFLETIKIDSALNLEDVTFSLVSNLEILRPYGKGNREPIFGSKNLQVSDIKIIAEKDTVIFTFEADNYRKIKGICFGKLDKFKKMVNNNFDEYDAQKILGGVLRNINFNIDIVYFLEINDYNNSVSVQMNIKDFRMCI